MEKQIVGDTLQRLVRNLVLVKDSNGEFGTNSLGDLQVDNSSFEHWEWISGVGLYGLWKYYALTQDKLAFDRIILWYDEHLPLSTEKNINTMSQMLTLAYVYEETRDKRYLPYLVQWSDWLYHGLPRTQNGGFQHMVHLDPNDNEMWADTLMMSVLPLAKIGLLLDRPDYVEEAKKQVLLHIQYLQDRHAGLWYHGWTFIDKNNFSGAFWGRGNAWAAIVLPEFLDLLNLPESDSLHLFLKTSFNYHIKSLVKYENNDGLWHTVLDDPQTYVETSAGAGFVYGMIKGINCHYLNDTDYAPALEKGINGLIRNVDASGTLLHVSGGTPMGVTKEFYQQIPTGWQPYGQGMAILALTEYLRRFY